MIVVSDTSPITSLLQIDRAELLTRIYSEVLIPPAVRHELVVFHPVRPAFIRTVPIVNPSECEKLLELMDAGEAEAIVLAKELGAEELLMDDAAGRRLAQKQGLNVIGLLGVILESKGRGFVPSVRDLMDELESRAGFYVSEPVRNLILREAGEL